VRTLIAAGVLTAAFLCAQTYRDLLLPQARSIVGTVLDVDGKPISEARIDHSDNPRERVTTDATGKFQIQTRAPALVIRKGGYRNQWLRTAHISEVSILRIHRWMGGAVLLSSSGGCERRTPRKRYRLRSPRLRNAESGNNPRKWTELELRSSINDRCLAIGTVPGDGVRHRPPNYDRCQRSNVRWKVRSLGKFGESASYHDVTEADARLLDRVLDGVCIRSNQR
jgi:hypothetical protein